MTVSEDNVLDISRSEVPHALGLEQRILAQTSVLSKRVKEPQPIFWRRQFFPLALAASVALFVVATMIEVPMLNNLNNPALVDSSDTQVILISEKMGLDDEADLQEFLLMQDEYLFAQI